MFETFATIMYRIVLGGLTAEIHVKTVIKPASVCVHYADETERKVVNRKIKTHNILPSNH